MIETTDTRIPDNLAHILDPSIHARYIRLPAAGKTCPFTGLKRGQMLNLVKKHKIRAAHLREAGQRRGSWVVWLPSMLAHLHKEADRTVATFSQEEVDALPSPKEEVEG